MPKKCQKNARKIQKNPKKCQKNARKMPEKCQKNAKKMPEKCQKNAKKIQKNPKKSKNYLLNTSDAVDDMKYVHLDIRRIIKIK